MKNKTTSALLAFFLGGFGAHRFYLGQTGLGLVYLLFVWTIIPVIVAFVDTVIFATMSEEAFNLKYNKGVSIASSLGQLNISDELEKLSALKEKGILTDAEFKERKARLLK